MLILIIPLSSLRGNRSVKIIITIVTWTVGDFVAALSAGRRWHISPSVLCSGGFGGETEAHSAAVWRPSPRFRAFLTVGAGAAEPERRIIFLLLIRSSLPVSFLLPLPAAGNSFASYKPGRWDGSEGGGVRRDRLRERVWRWDEALRRHCWRPPLTWLQTVTTATRRSALTPCWRPSFFLLLQTISR